MNKTKTSETQEISKYPNVEISVKNFGPIADATIDLRPLTVFVGPSNTGKTYFSTLIYALHGIFQGFSLLPGISREIEDFGFYRFFRPSDSEIRSILKKLNTPGRSFKFSDLPKETRDMVQSEIKDSESFHAELKRCFDLDSIMEMIKLNDDQSNEMLVSLKVSKKKQRLWNFNFETFKSEFTAHGSFNKSAVLQLTEQFTSKGKLDLDDLLYFRFPFELGSYIGNRAYLPAARSGIMQSHRVIASSLVERATRGGLTPLEVPTFSGIVADFMQQLILYEESKSPDEGMKHLAKAIESDILAGQILMKPTSSGYPEFLYRPQETGEDIRLTRAASMVSELAPVVLFLRSGICPSDTLIIEEPEAHLHPGAQTEIALNPCQLGPCWCARGCDNAQ